MPNTGLIFGLPAHKLHDTARAALQETRTPQKQQSSPGVHTAWHNFQRFYKLPTGEQFVTLFGTNQSMLEALLLKRKVMGPSWLAVAEASKGCNSEPGTALHQGFPFLIKMLMVVFSLLRCKTCANLNDLRDALLSTMIGFGWFTRTAQHCRRLEECSELAH